MFHVDWELDGREIFFEVRLANLFSKNLLGSGDRKQTTFLKPKSLIIQFFNSFKKNS